jgi:hypothetical protein
MHRDRVEHAGGPATRTKTASHYRSWLLVVAAQMAISLGFVDFGVLGATLVGLAFVLPQR